MAFSNTHGSIDLDGVLECLACQYLRDLEIFFDHLYDAAARQLGEYFFARVYGRNGRRTRQRQAQ
jgi:hypothetical protein